MAEEFYGGKLVAPFQKWTGAREVQSTHSAFAAPPWDTRKKQCVHGEMQSVEVTRQRCFFCSSAVRPMARSLSCIELYECTEGGLPRSLFKPFRDTTRVVK